MIPGTTAPDWFRIPVGDWASAALDWFKVACKGFLDVVGFVMNWLVESLGDGLIAIPFLLLIAIFALIGWAVRSWRFALGSIVTFLLIVAMNQWENAMYTLSLVLIATLVAIAIAVPLGIWAARNDRVSAAIKPVLDFMQTMPAFVYLIPAVIFFTVGFAPGVFATIIFALPPGVRFTELGIRGVDGETVEAGYAFGATPGEILRGIQLPLAMPTIMAGINQVIMLSLSMAVLAGFVGARGLGMDVVSAVSTQRLALGIEAGLSVVIIAVYLDRVTAALGNPNDFRGSLSALAKRRRSERPATAVTAAA